MRFLIGLLLLAGCAAPPTVKKVSDVVDCPASIQAPAPLVGHPTPAKVGALEIRVELAREKERDRGDCWKAAYEQVKK